MMMPKSCFRSSLIALALLSCSHSIVKAETSVREFLTWERSSQDSFFSISILTAAAIATQVRPNFAECITQWYTATKEGNTKRNTEMLGIMKKYPDLIPSGIVVAVLQKECGKFGNL